MQMNKLLITAATLFALAAPAYAGSTIPAVFHGEWCSNDGSSFYQSSKAEKASCGDGWLKITANRYDGWEQQCRPVNATKVSEVLKKEWGPSTYYLLKLRCTVEDGEKIDLTIKIRQHAYGHGKSISIEEKTND
jgi:hypothetical protein